MRGNTGDSGEARFKAAVNAVLQYRAGLVRCPRFTGSMQMGRGFLRTECHYRLVVSRQFKQEVTIEQDSDDK